MRGHLDGQTGKDTGHPEADSRELTENGHERTKRGVKDRGRQTVKKSEGTSKGKDRNQERQRKGIIGRQRNQSEAGRSEGLIYLTGVAMGNSIDDECVGRLCNQLTIIHPADGTS